MLLIDKLSSLAVVFNSMTYSINNCIYNNIEQKCCYSLQTNSNNREIPFLYTIYSMQLSPTFLITQKKCFKVYIVTVPQEIFALCRISLRFLT